MKLFYSLTGAFALLSIGNAARISESSIATATLTTIAIPAGTVVGSVNGDVEDFRGIPFAEPPVGSLRLRAPKRLGKFDTIQVTGVGPSCPQMTSFQTPPPFVQALEEPGVASAVLLGGSLGNETEDCLTISVSRPQGTKSDAKLPVLFWIFGGGFEIGSPQPYNASVLIPQAVAQDKPFIFVAVNYRLGGFGFLGGKEVLADGSSNLGLLDQRMGLEWVADNIAAFGGDADAVTIWGESAGSISVFNQLAMYDGNNLYKGRPLFRAAIMNSGSVVPLDGVDGDKAQSVFDTVVEAAGCSTVADEEKLSCLRGLDYQTYFNATNSVPGFLSYSSLSLSYQPRPDGKTITASADVLAKEGKYAAVPAIIGSLQDEETLFSLFQSNITTKSDLISYLNDVIYRDATREEITALVETYPYNNGSAGSPYDTSTLNEVYPQFKRLAAILGDLEFILSRRFFLETLPPSVPAWSFLATWGHGTPILGSFHTLDLPRIFFGTDNASLAIQDRYISFITSMDPNRGIGNAPAGHKTHWPKWHGKRALIEFGLNATSIIADDFRSSSYEYIKSHIDSFRY